MSLSNLTWSRSIWPSWQPDHLFCCQKVLMSITLWLHAQVTSDLWRLNISFKKYIKKNIMRHTLTKISGWKSLYHFCFSSLIFAFTFVNIQKPDPSLNGEAWSLRQSFVVTVPPDTSNIEPVSPFHDFRRKPSLHALRDAPCTRPFQFASRQAADFRITPRVISNHKDKVTRVNAIHKLQHGSRMGSLRAFVGSEAPPAGEYHDCDFEWEVCFFLLAVFTVQFIF